MRFTRQHSVDYSLPSPSYKRVQHIIQFHSIQFFIIYVPSQQLQDQLQTQRSVDTSNCNRDKQNIKSKTNYRQALEEKQINVGK
jgi:hypothetical protein